MAHRKGSDWQELGYIRVKIEEKALPIKELNMQNNLGAGRPRPVAEYRRRTVGPINRIAMVLLAVAMASQAPAGEAPRTVVSLDKDWRFHKGALELPGRVPVRDWLYRMEPKGRQAALDATAVMTAEALDTTGAGWKKGMRFEYEKDTSGDAWMEGGNHYPKGKPLFAWFRAQMPGVPAARPALEFGDVQGLVHIFVNGVMLKRHQSRAQSFVVDLQPVWKPAGVNTIALLVEAKGYGGLGGSPTFVDLAAEIPANSQLSTAYDDSAWTSVDVPHDFGGFGSGWYRKSLAVPACKPGSRVWLEFDGVYRMSRFWLNGKELGIHPSGYSPVRFDVTDVVQPGANTLAVSVDANIAEGWWYDGGGIYRHARLVVVPEVHVAPEGVFIRSTIPDCGDGITAPAATLELAVTANNSVKKAVVAEIENEVLDGSNHSVARLSNNNLPLAAGDNPLKQRITIPNVKLWSCEHPELYTLRTTLRIEGRVVDAVSTYFGVRKIEFNGERGFLLNDRPVKLKGTANHQNHAGVGAAIPDRLHVWRLEQLKKMGCNAIRYCYELDPFVYEACDRMGILVMGEFREFGDGYDAKVNENNTVDELRDQRAEVKRIRNHPSIVLWCLGNEEGAVQNNALGAEMAGKVKRMVDELDGTRPVTMAVVGGYAAEGVCGVVDVVGMNYNIGAFDAVRARFPGKPMIGTESTSEVSTRGCYDRTQFKNFFGLFHGDQERHFVSNYSENWPGWGASCEANWKAVAARPWVAGTFVWTGFDYGGEPTPFDSPSRSSVFGILDLCGFPKDSYWYYKSWWGSEPVIHVFPHWNWAGKEGQEIPVWVHSNAGEVELFLNGKSLGKKTMEHNSHLEWKVPYAPGKLEAKGLKDGKIISDIVETTGAPVGLTLAPDRAALTADGADLAWVKVSVVDEKGRVVPTAGNLVRFSVTGPGRIIGVGNGDATCAEPGQATQRSACNGLCMVLVQTTGQSGEIQLRAEADGLKTSVCPISAK